MGGLFVICCLRFGIQQCIDQYVYIYTYIYIYIYMDRFGRRVNAVEVLASS